MASLLRLSIPVVLCLFFIGSSTCIPSSILANVELRHQKLCQFDTNCQNCSLQVERQLLVEQGNELVDKLEKTEHGLLTSDGNEESANKLCAIPKFHDPQQYCCEMWSAFDCRTRVATDKCTFTGFVKYRKSLVQWASDLMLLNVCIDYDYGSKQCELQKALSQQNEVQTKP